MYALWNNIQRLEDREKYKIRKKPEINKLSTQKYNNIQIDDKSCH